LDLAGFFFQYKGIGSVLQEAWKKSEKKSFRFICGRKDKTENWFQKFI